MSLKEDVKVEVALRFEAPVDCFSFYWTKRRPIYVLFNSKIVPKSSQTIWRITWLPCLLEYSKCLLYFIFTLDMQYSSQSSINTFLNSLLLQILLKDGNWNNNVTVHHVAFKVINIWVLLESAGFPTCFIRHASSQVVFRATCINGLSWLCLLLEIENWKTSRVHQILHL